MNVTITGIEASTAKYVAPSKVTLNNVLEMNNAVSLCNGGLYVL